MEEIVKIEEINEIDEATDLAEIARKIAMEVEAEMNEKIERPDCVTDHHLTFVDILVFCAGTNEVKAPPYLVQRYGVEMSEAITIVNYWEKSYNERDHPWAGQFGNC